MRQEVLRMERVRCQEQGIVQLEDFSLSIFSGEIMGLLPANNHGLTAVLRLLQHNTPLLYGYVYYQGEQVNTWRAAKRRGNRIGLIQSESCLVEGLTVADNIFVLRPGFKTWLIRPSVLRRQLFSFLENIGIQIPADAYVEELTVFEKAVVDVLKSVVAGCKLIILRDISAHICEAELQKLHRLLKYYTGQGISFLYINFHFEELRQICHRAALMSNGRVIKVLQSDVITSEVFRHYTNVYSSKVKEEISRSVLVRKVQAPVFEADGLRGEAIHGLSFSITAGECVVLQDVDNEIFNELLSILTGEMAPKSGNIRLDGREAEPRVGKDIAVIQENPSKTMLFSEMSYLDNLCFSVDHRLPEVWRSRNVQEGIRLEYAGILGEEVFDKRVDMLNEIQKYELVYNRVAIQKPKVAFCVQPFHGADIELRMHIWEQLKMLLSKGIAVVILAVNLGDSLSLADRLIRLQRGKTQKTYLNSEFSTMPVCAPWIDIYQEVSFNMGSKLLGIQITGNTNYEIKKSELE